MQSSGVTSQHPVTALRWPPLGHSSFFRKHLWALCVWSLAHRGHVSCFCLQTVWSTLRGKAPPYISFYPSCLLIQKLSITFRDLLLISNILPRFINNQDDKYLIYSFLCFSH